MDGRLFVDRRAWWVALAVVIALGALLRGVGLGARGLVFYDEGVYACEGRFMAGALRSVPLALRYGWLARRGGEAAGPEMAALTERMRANVAAGRYPNFHKNTHSLLVGLFLLALGDRDWAALAEGVVFGLASILLVGVLARALFGEAGGLVAALALAVCPLHVLLSRGALAETDCAFFLLLAVALVRVSARGQPSPLRVLFAAGVATGLCFTSNHRVVVAAPIVWSMYAATLLARDRPLPGLRFRGLLWLCVGMVLPLVAWELLFVGAFRLLQAPAYGSLRTYFTRVAEHYGGQGVRDLGVGGGGTLFRFLWEYVGGAPLALAGAGLLLAARERRGEAAALVLPVAWVFVFFELRTQDQQLRYLGPALPFLALSAGAALLAVPIRTRLGRASLRMLPWVAAAALLAGIPAGARQWARDRSGLGTAIGWVREERAKGNGRGYFCMDSPLAVFYDPPGAGVRRLPDSRQEFESLYRAGVRYLVLTPTLLTQEGGPAYFWPLFLDLDAKVRSQDFENPAGESEYFADELYMLDTSSKEVWERKARLLSEVGGKVRVYDLNEYFRE
ncbi:MAG: glycosyltransferase family 39 protein [Planctomycetes bacterium]|nr:glycosyltransferase family 39 protein [Planctomycetota bacterium]